MKILFFLKSRITVAVIIWRAFCFVFSKGKRTETVSPGRETPHSLFMGTTSTARVGRGAYIREGSGEAVPGAAWLI